MAIFGARCTRRCQRRRATPNAKVYRYDGYGHRAEPGYLQIKGDRIYKDDGYGNKTLVGKVKKEKE